MYPHIKELVPPEMSGAAMTGINFFTMIGPALFPPGAGYFDANPLSGGPPGTGGLQRRIHGMYRQSVVGIGLLLFYQGEIFGGLRL